MAKGEFVALIDADSEIQHGAFHRWIEAFSDPRVGAVAGNVRVMNPEETLVTRLQEVEYASMMTLVTLVLARLRLLAIIHGQGGMVRAKAGASIGWYDAGLGDDTDLSVRLLKAGWKLESCTEAVVYTHVPSTFRGVIKQRRRWMKNRVRVRASKHYDMASVQLRYGLFNSLVGFRNLIRLQEPGLFLVYLIVAFVEDPLVNPYWLPGIMSGMYIFATVRIFVKALIARDFCGTPAPRGFVLIPLLPLYLIILRFCVDIEILLEGLRINRYVPYVPRRIWPQVPPW
jgi:cellulose synthase/poly-beta-1,6-N-acetylglucosamine synthase-like glycosyltransferase